MPPMLHADEDAEYAPYINASPVMTRIRRKIEQVAGLDVHILLLGESGVGKDVSARMIHKLSHRADRTFLKINCAALPADLLESELFGYEAGAFTGANKLKLGKFELCNKGTIFLDEIGEMPAGMQAKLLQVLEDRQFSRLGGRSVITVDVRILAATNLDLEEALDSGLFRRDLYYRLSAITLNLPPLRERTVEIAPMLNYFLVHWSTQMGIEGKPFSAAMVAACMEYEWPGNVRELENFVKRYLVLDDELAAQGELINKTSKVFATNGASNGLTRQDMPVNLRVMMRDIKVRAEKEAIEHALSFTRGNRNEAAKALGISTKALLYKMRDYGVEKESTPVNGHAPSAAKLDADSNHAATVAGQEQNAFGMTNGAEMSPTPDLKTKEHERGNANPERSTDGHV